MRHNFYQPLNSEKSGRQLFQLPDYWYTPTLTGIDCSKPMSAIMLELAYDVVII